MQTTGVFTDCRSHWKGRIGSAAVSLAKTQGGILSFGSDGPDRHHGLARTALDFAARVRLVCRSEAGSADYGDSVLIRQENDPQPKFHFLEEGAVRLGMRVAFDLIDDAGHYHGDGRQDLWLYAEGDLHCTFSLQIIDPIGHGPIQDAHIAVKGDSAYTRLRVGPERIVRQGEITRPFGDALAERAIVAESEQGLCALYWARDEGHAWQGSDHGPTPPFYASHWPTGMQQWARGGMGWACHGETACLYASVWEEGPTARFHWLRDARLEAHDEGQATFTATLVASLAADAKDLERRITAVQHPLEPQVAGGVFRCYTDEDGTYEVGQGDPTAAQITFPPDPQARTVRLRYFRRKTDPRHRGGIRATVNEQPIPVQLVSEGELTDDICVPMDMSHKNDSIDDAIVAARLDRDRPTEIRIEKTPGIQATYQSEITGLDLNRRAGNHRDIAVWTSHNHHAPLLEFDLFSGAVHRLTAHDQTEPVLWEMPMAFFKSCGISKHHYLNQVREFRLDQNGAEVVSLYFRATNPNQRAQSETWLTIPYDHPRPRLEVRMKMTVLEEWDAQNAEFSDIFPYPSRLPETWFHDAVLFVQRDRTFLKPSLRPDLSVGSGPDSDDPRLFYALYPSDRGNVLALFDNPHHPEHKFHYSVCGNYVDVHVNYSGYDMPLPAGTAFEVRYICEIYGDENTAIDQLKDIGLRSCEAGDIVIE